jgi:hypothetical protein
MSVSPESKGLTAQYIVNAMKGKAEAKPKVAMNTGVSDSFTGTADNGTLAAAQRRLRNLGGMFSHAKLTCVNDNHTRTCTIKIML